MQQFHDHNCCSCVVLRPYIVYKTVRRVTAAAPLSAFNDGAGMPIEFFETQLKVCDIELVSQQTSSHLILHKKQCVCYNLILLLSVDDCSWKQLQTAIFGSYRNSQYKHDIETSAGA